MNRLPILAACLALGACSSLTDLTASTELRASQALYTAEAAFAGASVGLDAGVKSGLLKGPSAAKTKGLYEKAHTELLAARQAKAKADFALELLQAKAALSDAGSVQSQLPAT